MADFLAQLSEEERRQLRKEGAAAWRPPMLATLTYDHFSDPGWIYERKFDGERALAIRDGKRTRLMSRNEKDIGNSYPELIEALEKLPNDDFVADGEIVAFDGAVSSFSRLQQRMKLTDPEEARNSGVTVYFYLFDLLHLDGRNLERLPLRSRKQLLRQAFDFSDPLRYTEHRNPDGEAYHEEACRKGWEGIIAKDAEAAYTRGRSTDWLKFKCAHGQELVIGGFTAPKGSRTGFGALLVGYYEDGKLRYAGKVGTGYDETFLKKFRARMDKLTRKTSPFDDEVKEREVTWISPKLVGEFGFTEWTGDGKLRHPRFLGLRRDKAAKDVVREELDG